VRWRTDGGGESDSLVPADVDVIDAARGSADRRPGHPTGADMNSLKFAAMMLILAGVLGLAYGGFSYTKQTHDVSVGPVEISVQERERFNVPVWAGIGAIAAGAALLMVGARRS
jgi:hypothetical protein